MVDPQKIEAVKNNVHPSFVKVVRSFMGRARYHQFVKKISSISTDLSNVTK